MHWKETSLHTEKENEPCEGDGMSLGLLGTVSHFNKAQGTSEHHCVGSHVSWAM